MCDFPAAVRNKLITERERGDERGGRERERERERERDRQTDRQTNTWIKETNRQIEAKTGADWQTQKVQNRDREKETEIK